MDHVPQKGRSEGNDQPPSRDSNPPIEDVKVPGPHSSENLEVDALHHFGREEFASLSASQIGSGIPEIPGGSPGIKVRFRRLARARVCVASSPVGADASRLSPSRPEGAR